MLRSWFFSHIAQTSPSPMALEIAFGEGNYLFDTQGNRYLDLIAGISVSNVGHSNKAVLEAIRKQTELHLHTLVYGEHIQTRQVALARALAETLPPELSRIYFVNSGSEAVEGAMKLAKRYTGRFEILACDRAYHGSSQGALSLNGDEYFKRNFRPLLPGIGQIHYGSFSDLEKINQKTAAVFIETVQGEAGIRVACSRYFQELRQRCTETGTLLVVDEIQTGYGRTGTFWGFEKLGFIPDIVLMAKAMGGGMPLGAFAAAPEIMDCLTANPVLGHISTFGGHPLSCAASLAALNFIRENSLCEKIKEKEHLFHRLLQHPEILEVRSSGLMMAAELGSFEKVLAVIDYCLKNGLITDWFLHCNTALRIAPPLTLESSEIEWACSLICAALDEAG
jgi:putrescine aminotransferase